MNTRSSALILAAIAAISSPSQARAGLKCSAFQNTILPAYQAEYEELSRDQIKRGREREAIDIVLAGLRKQSGELGSHIAERLREDGVASAVQGYHFRKDLLPRNSVQTGPSDEERILIETEGRPLAGRVVRAYVDATDELTRGIRAWVKSARYEDLNNYNRRNVPDDKQLLGFTNRAKLTVDGNVFERGSLFIAPVREELSYSEPRPVIRLKGIVQKDSRYARYIADMELNILTGEVKVTSLRYGGPNGKRSNLLELPPVPESVSFEKFREKRLKQDGLTGAYKYCENLETDRREREQANTGQNKPERNQGQNDGIHVAPRPATAADL